MCFPHDFYENWNYLTGSGPVTATTVHGRGPFETACSSLAAWAHNDSVSIYERAGFFFPIQLKRHRQVSVFCARSEDVIDTVRHGAYGQSLIWFLCVFDADHRVAADAKSIQKSQIAKSSRLHLAKGGWMFEVSGFFTASAGFRYCSCQLKPPRIRFALAIPRGDNKMPWGLKGGAQYILVL